MDRNRGHQSIFVFPYPVRTFLVHLDKTEFGDNFCHFFSSNNGQFHHYISISISDKPLKWSSGMKVYAVSFVNMKVYAVSFVNSLYFAFLGLVFFTPVREGVVQRSDEVILATSAELDNVLVELESELGRPVHDAVVQLLLTQV